MHMSRLSVLLATLLLAAAFSVCAQSSEEQYVRIYNLIQQADALNSNGQFTQALPKYLEAQSALQRIQKFNPTWNPKVVSYRLGYIAERIEAGPGTASNSPAKRAAAPPAAPAPATTASTTKPEAPPTAGTPAAGPNAAELQNAVARLQADKAILEAKLKEALATQPTAADPRELAKAQERIQLLLKENTLLKTSLDAEKAKPGNAADAKQIDELKNLLAEANQNLTNQSARATVLLAEQHELQRRLEAAAAQSASEKTASQERINQLAATAAAAEALRAENAILKQQLAQTKTSIPSPDETKRTPTEAEARIAALQSDAQVLRLEKQALETRLTTSVASASTNTANKELVAKVDQLTKEVTGLRAKVEVFEARSVPYTAEELALFQTESSKALAYTPDPRRKARTLSAGSAALVAEAQRNFAAKDYAKAEQNYLDVLQQDEGNTTALANLATIQMEAGKLVAAEKSIQQALAAEPNDGFNLATLGKIKFQEEKYDEALDVLSRAAKVIPQNAEIQNYLGVTLSQKGLRGPAETALRKAIQIDSNYGSAHNNLAVIYATQTPPLIELARWHYQKALAAGHPKNDDLEKLFTKKESAAK